MGEKHSPVARAPYSREARPSPKETLKKSASGRKRKAHGAQRPRHIK